MKEHPIIFSGPMVLAILEGRKTMTRRPLKPRPGTGRVKKITFGDQWRGFTHQWDTDDKIISCPYGQPEDRLWVRERIASWMHAPGLDLGGLEGKLDQENIIYKADSEKDWADMQHDRKLFLKNKDCTPRDDVGNWVIRSSIFMPRWASRITLEITHIGVERLQEITEEDAKQEGTMASESVEMKDGSLCYSNPFRNIWNNIYGVDNPNAWESNPWVWVISFKRLD